MTGKQNKLQAKASTPPQAENKKVWGGRFGKAMAQELVDFNASIHFDQRLAKEDVQGSIAHCKMLEAAGLLTEKEARAILKGLEKIGKEIEEDSFHFRKEDEDIHMNIERRLVELAGDLGKKIHMGRSRNDQVALDTRLYTRTAIDHCLTLLKNLQSLLVETAEEHLDTLLPGYTHLQRAQPISLAHYLLAYFEMFERDRTRLEEIRARVNVMPLGSGALAGTTLPLNREMVAKSLRFTSITRNSLDAVSDRDYIIEFSAAASLIMMHLSRMAEEWVLWSSSEFKFIDIDESLCTGSSMMPQKKNPDLPELVRGKTGRVYGHLMALLTLLKALPLTYNKDLQEDKEPLFDTYDTLIGSISIMTKVLSGTKFLRDRMMEAATEPYILATDLAEYLVQRNVPFRTAHEIVGKTVRYCMENHKGLTDLYLKEFQKISEHYEQGVMELLDVHKSVDGRKLPGGTGRSAIKNALREAKELLKK